MRCKKALQSTLLLPVYIQLAGDSIEKSGIFAGKLFPGPHLYAGAGIVALWATAASLVPAMQKGNDTARTLHITLNCINIGLFAWQVIVLALTSNANSARKECLLSCSTSNSIKILKVLVLYIPIAFLPFTKSFVSFADTYWAGDCRQGAAIHKLPLG